MARIDLLKRVMDGMDATEEEARSFLQKLVPVVLLEDYEPSEVTPQPKWRECFGGFYQGAAAGQYTMIHLRNWPGSGVLIVLDYMIVSVGAANPVSLFYDVTGYAALATTKGFSDLRIAGRPVGQLRYGTNAAHQGDTQLAYLPIGANLPLKVDGPWILEGGAAGQAIGFETGVQNQGMTVYFKWRERDV